jgi:MltA-interacting protein MipA
MNTSHTRCPNSALLAMCKWVLIAAWVGGLAPAVLAQTVTAEPEMPMAETPAPSETSAHRWRYTLGMKLKIRELANGHTELLLRPVLGVRYGRWRLGHATGDEWLAFSGYRKESNLAYQLRDDERLKVSLSLRVQNLQDNSSFDGFSSGKNTLRARVGVNYALNKRWSVGTDVTQDLMDRGDGTTLSVGASYGLPLSERSALSLSGGVNWATADHWAIQHRLLTPPPGGWRAGLGSVGLGMSYRYALTPQWAWFGTVGSSRHLGQVDAVSPSTLSWSGQIGVLYFSR